MICLKRKESGESDCGNFSFYLLALSELIGTISCKDSGFQSYSTLSEDRMTAACFLVRGGKSGLHGKTVPGNARAG